ncbi:MAG: hypothetical protein VX777_06205 [Chlamydiota bacterium]|nr:hypothetical protein [Chlamydiota bacterium]
MNNKVSSSSSLKQEMLPTLKVTSPRDKKEKKRSPTQNSILSITLSPKAKHKEKPPMRKATSLGGKNCNWGSDGYFSGKLESLSIKDFDKFDKCDIEQINYKDLLEVTPRRRKHLYSKISIGVIHDLLAVSDDWSKMCFQEMPFDVVTKWIIYLFDVDTSEQDLQKELKKIFTAIVLDKNNQNHFARLIAVFKNLDEDDFYLEDKVEDLDKDLKNVIHDTLRARKRIVRQQFLDYLGFYELKFIVEHCHAKELDRVFEQCRNIEEVDILYGIVSKFQEKVESFFFPISDSEIDGFEDHLLYCKNQNRHKLYLAFKELWKDNSKLTAYAVSIGKLLTLPAEYSTTLSNRMIQLFCKHLNRKAWSYILIDIEAVDLMGLRKFKYLPTQVEFYAYNFMDERDFWGFINSKKRHPLLDSNPAFVAMMGMKYVDRYLVMSLMTSTNDLIEETSDCLQLIHRERQECALELSKAQKVLEENVIERNALLERVTVLEKNVSSLTSVITAQTEMIKEQGSMITKMSKRILNDSLF